jgi:mycothiol synthase
MAAEPAHPDLTWVPLAAEHVPAWHRLLEACVEADGGEEHLTVEDLHDELEPEWLDLGRDSLLGLDADGVARAFGVTLVRPGESAERRVTLWGGVDPQWRGRGIGRELLDRQVARAGEIRDAATDGRPTAVYVSAREDVSSAVRLLARAGFEKVRLNHVMLRALPKAGGTLPEVGVPDGVRLVTYTDDLSEPLLEAHNRAFAGHWGFVPWTPEEWRLWAVEQRWFRPGWSVVALSGDPADGGIAGYATSAGYEPDWGPQGFTEGWTSRLGVVPSWRGRGLAKALLAESMRRFAADGIEYAGLDVDAENVSGALALYTGMGYQVRSTTGTWRHPQR